jgi:hypothetical protein
MPHRNKTSSESRNSLKLPAVLNLEAVGFITSATLYQFQLYSFSNYIEEPECVMTSFCMLLIKYHVIKFIFSQYMFFKIPPYL